MVNKKCVIIATIVAIVVVAIIVGIKIKSLQEEYTISDNFKEEIASSQESNNTSENNVEEKNNTAIENISNENNISDENNVSENENIINQNQENTSSTQNQTTSNGTSDANSTNNNTSNVIEQNSEEKALNLAKNKWGKDDENVYFYIEDEVSKDIYIVSVRSKETTAAVVSYKIDVNNEIVSEY